MALKVLRHQPVSLVNRMSRSECNLTYATFVMNNRERGGTGYSPADIFLGRRTWRLEMPFANAGTWNHGFKNKIGWHRPCRIN